MARQIISCHETFAAYGLPDFSLQVAELDEQDGIPKGWYVFDFIADSVLGDYVFFSGPEHRQSKETAMEAAATLIRYKENEGRFLQLIVPKSGAE